VLDTLVVLGDQQGFEEAVRNVIDWVSFDVNTKPQVFETTIRVLGGLLSGHIFANQTGQPFHLPWYRGELLDLAYDLGNRLLPAFSTPTGLPYARVWTLLLLSSYLILPEDQFTAWDNEGRKPRNMSVPLRAGDKYYQLIPDQALLGRAL